MIDRLLLQEFQSHEQADFQLAPITVFVGDNGAGKSAVIRSLRWLFLNKPSGDSMVRWGSKRCRVQALVDNRRVGKTRDRGSLKYKLDEESFSAVGTGVPEPVADHLSVSERINFQGQHDSPFLLNLSGGQAAQELNRIVDLESVDRTIAEATKAKRARRVALDVAEKRVALKEQQVEQVLFAPRFLADARKVVALEEKSVEAYNDQAGLAEALGKIRDMLSFREKADLLGDLADSITALEERTAEIRGRQMALRDLLDAIECSREVLKEEPPELPVDLYDAMVSAQQERDRLRELVDKVLDAELDFDDAVKQVEKAEGMVAEFSVCPTCGGIVTT